MEKQSRRALLKKSVAAAGAAGVVWSAPRVEGLSLRPDYAAAQSGAESQWSIRLTRTASGFSPIPASVVPPGPAADISVQSAASNASGISVTLFADHRAGVSMGGFNTCRSFNLDLLSTAGVATADRLGPIGFITSRFALGGSNASGRVLFPGGADTNQIRLQGNITCD